MPEPTARAWLAMLSAGQLSSRELTEHYLRRVEAENDRLNAVAAIDPERALAEADAADRARREGQAGRLLGLPITVKDSLDAVGLPCSGGTAARAGHRPRRDATVVGRARAAGAIVLAKTNLPEYQWSYQTDNALQGRTANPLDGARTAGGSSGGEGALIGADASPLGIGTDGGGSIRVPSHYCGIVGIRPSVGMTPETGVWPPTRATGMLGLLCTGPMGRSVDDLALLLAVIAGADDADPYSVPARPGDLDTVDPRQLRVGWYVEDGVAQPTEATRETVERAAEAFGHLGASVEHAPPPPEIRTATELFFAAMAADGGARARADLEPAGDRLDPALKELLATLKPLAQDAAGAFAVQERIFLLRARIRAERERFDVVLCPVAPGPAPPHGGWPGEAAGNTSFDAFNHVHAQALAGLPAASVPVGEEDGMPLGVQVVGRAFEDHVALAAARVLEQAVGGFHRVGARAVAPLD